MPELLQPASTVTLPRLPVGWTPLAYSVTQVGQLAILADDHEVAARSFRGQPGFDPGSFRRRVVRATAKLFVFDGRLTELFTFPLETPFPSIESLQDGRWLITPRRTDVAVNARLFTQGGNLSATFMLGDGITEVRTDVRGRIWVAWFDEGIFGNDDWKVPGRESPPSFRAIVCFDDRGGVVWEPEYLTGGDPADCYALNIVGESAWAWTWTHRGHQIRRFEIGAAVQCWKSDLEGATAIALAGEHLIVADGHGAAAVQLALVQLDGEGVATTQHRWTLALPPQQLSEAALLSGRGDQIHAVCAGGWHRWTVAQCVAAGRT